MGRNVLKEARRRAAAKQFDDAQRRALVSRQGAERVYRCAGCGKTFTAAWSDEEARAEADQVFGDATAAPQDVVCDRCFEAMKRAGIFPS